MIEKSCVVRGDGSYVRARFVLPSTIWADSIHLVGDLNDWSPASHPLQRDRLGQWVLTVDLPVGRSYEFRYLCDGHQWMTENHADGCVLSRRDGGYSCVITTDLPCGLAVEPLRASVAA